jgi:hypothetical protein
MGSILQLGNNYVEDGGAVSRLLAHSLLLVNFSTKQKGNSQEE